MKTADIINYARTHIEPIGTTAPAYRCSAYLSDGTFLPCVLLERRAEQVDLAMRRFDESKLRREGTGMDYRSIVTSFVAKGNRVNEYNLSRIERSRYAIPVERAKEIKGETSMAWTEFTAVMDDGKEFPFGTTFLMEFFEMPEGYSADRIQKIIPSERGKPRFRSIDNKIRVYRERPYFTCYVDGL